MYTREYSIESVESYLNEDDKKEVQALIEKAQETKSYYAYVTCGHIDYNNDICGIIMRGDEAIGTFVYDNWTASESSEIMLYFATEEECNKFYGTLPATEIYRICKGAYVPTSYR